MLEIAVLAILFALVIPSCARRLDAFWQNLTAEYFNRAEFCLIRSQNGLKYDEMWKNLSERYARRGRLCSWGWSDDPSREKRIYTRLLIEELILLGQEERHHREQIARGSDRTR